MIRIRIGIDIDGCLFPWTRAANDALVTKFGIEDPGEHQDWDYLERIVGGKKFSWLWTSEAAEMVFGRLDLIYPGAADAVNALAKAHEVHFVTHRNPYRTAEATGRWLRYWFHDYKGVHTITSRVPKWTLGDWDVFIDDKPSTVEGFLLHTESQVLMPHRPWNTLETDITIRYALPRFGVFADWSEVEGLIREGVAA